MRVGSGSDSIYSLFLPRTRKEDPSETSSEVTSPSGSAFFAGALSDTAAAAALQAKLAQSSFDRNDIDHDGYVDRSEFIENNMKVRDDGYRPELADVQRQWSEIDKAGSGRLDADQYAEGFNSVFKVSVGHFDKPLR